MKKLLIATALLMAIALPAAAQQGKSFNDSASSVERDLEKALADLTKLRAQIADEKIPLNRRLRELELELSDARGEFEQVTRDLDRRTLDLGKVEGEISGRRDEATYLSGLLDEYARNFESSVHISELQLYRDQIEAVRAAPEDESLTAGQQFAQQVALVQTSLDRQLELVGGRQFDGKAVADNGAVKDVRFALIGPLALYRSQDGMAELMIGSLEPRLVAFDTPELTADASAVVASGVGRMPLDPTGGSARRIEAATDSFRDEIEKGGIVMIAILLLAGASLIVAIIKMIQLSRVRMPAQEKINAFLNSVKSGNFAKAKKDVDALPGPTGEMLRAGFDHVAEPKELVEEVMFEKVLETRLSLNRLLSFIAVSAAAAPLMGLLGTVTGIINTFKMITVFGTGDASTLSGGISEALITTKFGLIVAIPSLFLHAYLSRKSKRVLDRMEKTGMSFLNRIPTGSMPNPTDLAKADGDKNDDTGVMAMPGAVAMPVMASSSTDQ